MVAIGLAFALMVFLVQATMLVVARNSAQAATAQATRRAATTGAMADEIERDLSDALAATVPGARHIATSVTVEADGVFATSTIIWSPPGPDLMDVTFSVSSVAALVSPP